MWAKSASVKKLTLSTFFVVALVVPTVLGAIPFRVVTPVGVVSTEASEAEARNRDTRANRPRTVQARNGGAQLVQSFSADRKRYTVNVRESTSRANIRIGIREGQQHRWRIDTRNAAGHWRNGSYNSWRARADRNINRDVRVSVGQGQERRLRVQIKDRNGNVRTITVNVRRASSALLGFTGTRGLRNLETQLRNLTRNFDGRQSIYVKNLNTNEYMLLNNSVRHNPASLMKLFVVGAAHEQIARGRMQMTPQIRRWMHETITISTNDSYNWLLFHMGQGCVRRGLNRVTDFARRHGYTATIGGHSFGVHPQPNQVVVRGGNRTTARDVGLFMEDVYRGGVVSRRASNQIMDSLRRQQRLNKIPAGLPAGVRSASKTGEWAGYEHDAAIVFSRGATYVIVVMSTPEDNSIRNIRTISRRVFNYFN